MKRTLILTAIEETWPSFDTPVIFLGEWCKIYNRREVWEKYDSQTFSYHWDDRQKFKNDYFKLQNLYEDILLPEITRNLNQIHGIDRSLEFWRIVVGPWLGYFTHIAFDRYETVRSTVGLRETLTFPNLHDFDVDQITPNDSSDFFLLHIIDHWNQYLYEKALEYLVLEIDRKKKCLLSRNQNQKRRKQTVTEKGREVLKDIFYALTSFSISDTEAYFISDYFPGKVSFLLQLKLGQIPRRRRNLELESFKFQKSVRDKWQISDSQPGFEEFIKSLLPLQIPKVYIEGFNLLQVEVTKRNWPKKPRLIFTSNSHIGNDSFKLFVAEKKREGTPLVLSQHGGFFGIGELSFLEDHEKRIADRYLTWGWADSDQSNVYPTGCNKLTSFTKVKTDKDGDAILVLNGIPRYSYYMYSIPQAGQHLLYMEDQWKFVGGLTHEIRQKLSVRLYPQDYGWCQELRWLERFPELDYMNKSISLEKVIDKYRIYIATYNATTYLESFYRDIPTIIYWNPNHWEIREEAKPYFSLLEEVGIFHSSPDSASKFLNRHWNQIDLWWNQRNVQKAKLEFLDRYCKKIENPIREFYSRLQFEVQSES
ncbi:LIC12162 family transferase [Leptospira yasudae]|uniref:LIC12162 family transferase n=1 Tax=Leptospira yasudae TaxID=2202201 RepID=UPI0013147CA9|nr:LIC12162 family protein [Leptospira yasudae]